MLDEILARVDRRLDAVGMTAAEACIKAGLSKTFLTLTRRASETRSAHGGSVALFAQLAVVLNTSVGWLIDGSGEEEVGHPDVTVREKQGRIQSVAWDDVFSSSGGSLTSQLESVPAEKQFSLMLSTSRLPELGVEGAILQCVSWLPGDLIADRDFLLVEKSTVWGKWKRQAVCRAIKTSEGFEARSLGPGEVSRGILHLSSQKLRDCIYPIGKITHSIRIL